MTSEMMNGKVSKKRKKEKKEEKKISIIILSPSIKITIITKKCERERGHPTHQRLRKTRKTHWRVDDNNGENYIEKTTMTMMITWVKISPALACTSAITAKMWPNPGFCTSTYFTSFSPDFYQGVLLVLVRGVKLSAFTLYGVKFS